MYVGSQLFLEALQNADDARASTFKIVLDERHHSPFTSVDPSSSSSSSAFKTFFRPLQGSRVATAMTSNGIVLDKGLDRITVSIHALSNIRSSLNK